MMVEHVDLRSGAPYFGLRCAWTPRDEYEEDFGLCGYDIHKCIRCDNGFCRHHTEARYPRHCPACATDEE